ncbi:MAG: hypothetical protein RMZ43_007535 [Nostoc sp. CmiVER01]|uniref:hypothetical protein n=1 Tax=Nostoc sp. CmiVER01 TaxID=3075384 RepID=UPI002AD57ADF|nr:hypothetical protein [Nostoc sp. CmiVER01]MDZ8121428.1 hypothetical protein [Nostoc sp. CmiVER01]
MERAFFEAGKALAELHDGLRPTVSDRRLYRSTRLKVFIDNPCWVTKLRVINNRLSSSASVI